MVYARKDLGADVIFDMATLTGAQGISTGRYHGGVLTNSEEWEGLAVQAGKNSGDLVVCVPILSMPCLNTDEGGNACVSVCLSVAFCHITRPPMQ